MEGNLLANSTCKNQYAKTIYKTNLFKKSFNIIYDMNISGSIKVQIINN